MIIYVSCWPILAKQAGELIPRIGEGDLNSVLKIISLALIIFLIQKLAQFFQDITLARPALKISQDIRERVFKKLQKIELMSLEKMSVGDITYRLTEDADRVGEVIYKTIQDTIPCILQLVVVYGYMVYLDIKLSLATLLLAPLIALLVGNFGSKVMSTAEKSQIQVSELASLLAETIQGLPLVRGFAAEEWMKSRFDEEINLHRKARYRTLRLLALQHPVVGFIEASGILTVFAIGAARIQSGAIDPQGFSSYIASLLMLIDPISHLTSNYNEFKQGQASLKRLSAIEDEPSESTDLKNAITLRNAKGCIRLENISYSYDGRKNVINNLSLTIDKGKIIALVGPSGGGKSTVFSLIMRFMQPTSGRILFDNEDITMLRRKDLRRQIALVPQSSTSFSGSILDSILFGRDYDLEKVIEAAKIANAHDFIMNMPNNYYTKLQERASNISGGQLQRIAIARAVLGNPTVLLLDEATSSLDAEAERAVQVGLEQAMADRTVLIIAHRLSTVQEANKIVFLENGSLIEIGDHDYLMSKKGRYMDLCSNQLIRQ
tara:strand:- start:1509 stop:3155 length:1647 start_codon:yes stop_codon:yes gene_type:complete